MQLRDYQITIAAQTNELLLRYKIAYLCLEVRTGKTLTALEAARLYGAKDVLFVTKKKAIGSIQQDYEATGKHFNLYLINYDSLHKVVEKFDLIILDEAHSIAQYPIPANRTKELKRICKDLPIIFLSGTPSPESFAQFYHQFFVSSYSPFNQYANFYKWHKEFGIPKKKYLYGREIADYSCVKMDLLKPIINKYMISFSQIDAGFEMFVEEEILKVPMSEKIQKAITILRRDKVFTTKAGMTILADTAVKEMQKVHQLCGGTVKAECGTGIVFDTTKVDFIKERFKGQKIAIFYKYIAEGIALRDAFKGRVYDDPIDFNKADNDAVFICQVQSGREGINVSTADCLVMYNIDFSALSYWQSRARLQTKNRVKKAMVYWIFTDGGIEEKIYQTVLNKKDFTTVHYKKSNF